MYHAAAELSNYIAKKSSYAYHRRERIPLTVNKVIRRGHALLSPYLKIVEKAIHIEFLTYPTANLKQEKEILFKVEIKSS